MGLFDGISQSGGLFGGLTQKVMPFAQNNNMALLGAGMGLLSGQGWGAGAGGFMQGAQADQARHGNALRQQLMQQDAQRQQTLFDQQQEDRKLQQQKANATQQWFKANMPDYADAPDSVRAAVIGSMFGKQKPTSAIQEYEYAKSQDPSIGSFMDYETSLKKAGATNINMNNEQSKAAGYADRMIQSEQILRQTEDAGTSLYNRSAGDVPVIGNYLTSDDYKSFEQAKRDFVNSILRRESGAVISPSEFENAEKQYFPQPGDGKEVIEQKRRNRATAIQGIIRGAGPAYTPATIPSAEGSSGGEWQTLPNGVRIREKR